MNCTKNEKLNQVTMNSLVVGVDFARAFNWRGMGLARVFALENNDINIYQLVDIAKSRSAAEDVIDELDFEISVGQLHDMMSLLLRGTYSYLISALLQWKERWRIA